MTEYWNISHRISFGMRYIVFWTHILLESDHMNMNKDSDEVFKFNGIDVLIKIINERSGEVGRVQ